MIDRPVDERATDACASRAAGPPWFVLVGIAAIQIAGSFGASRNQPDARDLDVLAIVLLLAGPALLWRTGRRPVLGEIAVFVVTFAYFARGYAPGPVVISAVVALIRSVLAGHRRAAWIVAAGGVASLVGAHAIAGDRSEGGWLSALVVAGWVAVVLIAADLVRSRLARRDAARAARVEQQRRQASEERLRIAQELHDVLAHDISLINVQAGVGLHLVDAHPEQARAALAAIRDASKDALGELRAALDLLRGTAPAPRAPTGGLADLDALAARVRTTDLDVRVERTGSPRALPPGVDLAAYRIVQEALTNVVRHARGATTARVRVDVRDDAVVVAVDDDGAGPGARDGRDGHPVDGAHAGNGLAGMRERAAALGGSFDAGARPGRGFRVRAVLPT